MNEIVNIIDRRAGVGRPGQASVQSDQASRNRRNEVQDRNGDMHAARRDAAEAVRRIVALSAVRG